MVAVLVFVAMEVVGWGGICSDGGGCDGGYCVCISKQVNKVCTG